MQTHAAMRERQLNVRLSEAENVRFDAVAAHYGLNPQALVRMLVKKEADLLGVALPAPRSSAEAMARHHARREADHAAQVAAAVGDAAPKKAPKKTAKK